MSGGSEQPKFTSNNPEKLTVVVIVAYHDLFHLAVFTHLAPKVLIEGVKMILQLTRVHLILRVESGILIEVW